MLLHGSAKIFLITKKGLAISLWSHIHFEGWKQAALGRCVRSLSWADSVKSETTTAHQLFGTQAVPTSQKPVLTLNGRTFLLLQWHQAAARPSVSLLQGEIFWCTKLCLRLGWDTSSAWSVSEIPICSLCKQEAPDPRGRPVQHYTNTLADVSTMHISPAAQFFRD